MTVYIYFLLHHIKTSLVPAPDYPQTSQIHILAGIADWIKTELDFDNHDRMRSFLRPQTLQRSKPLQQAQIAHVTCRVHRKNCTEMTPYYIHPCHPQLMFHATLIKFDIFWRIIRAAPFGPFRSGRGSVSGRGGSVDVDGAPPSLTWHGAPSRVHPGPGGRDGTDEEFALRRTELQQLGAVQHRN